MKTFRIFLTLSLLAAFATNCKKESNDNDFEGLRVTKDGVEWTAPTATGALLSDKISLSGIDQGSLKTLSLFLPAGIAAGDHDIDPFGDVVASYGEGFNIFAPAVGRLTVTEHDTAGKRIKGTFSFTAPDAMSGTVSNFTGGEFNVAYQ